MTACETPWPEPLPLGRVSGTSDPFEVALAFHRTLREEVASDASGLGERDWGLLRAHHCVMADPERYPPPLVETVYACRRRHAVRAILGAEAPLVFDAGCGYGSESFLFAGLGARVIGVDSSGERLAVARRRRPFYEQVFGRRLDVRFEAADLDDYDPPEQGLSLTWLASVLAALRDQEGFLTRVRTATRPGGLVMVTDMNLLNPLFLWREWRRRREARGVCDALARRGSFRAMVGRQGRRGALYHPRRDGGLFDDVQFFTPKTLARLLEGCGWTVAPPEFSGVVPPGIVGPPAAARLERFLSSHGPWRRHAYFYLLSGRSEY